MNQAARQYAYAVADPDSAKNAEVEITGLRLAATYDDIIELPVSAYSFACRDNELGTEETGLTLFTANWDSYAFLLGVSRLGEDPDGGALRGAAERMSKPWDAAAEWPYSDEDWTPFIEADVRAAEQLARAELGSRLPERLYMDPLYLDMDRESYVTNGNGTLHGSTEENVMVLYYDSAAGERESLYFYREGPDAPWVLESGGL